MTFVADESVDRQVVDALRQDGHVVLYVAEEGPGVPDAEVLDLAEKEGAPLITADKDFGETFFRQGRVSSGVILLRLAGLSQRAKGETVVRVVREHAKELPRAFTVISRGVVRIRQPRR